MNIIIRPESNNDFQNIFDLVKSAFSDMEESDHKEQLLVERLRQSDAYVPQLSLIATTDNGLIVGFVMLTKIDIVTDHGNETALAVAPLAVLPQFQHQGIGGRLLLESHRIAADLGYKSAFLLGHKDYYPKFGYSKAENFGISFPFEAPSECCMAIELVPKALQGICGIIKYHDAFFK